MARSPARPHPPLSLRDAVELPQAIGDNNAARPWNRILLAGAMGLSPSSSGFRERVMASFRYALTEGNYKSETISLTTIGERIARPRSDNERVEALRGAFRNVPIFAQLIDHFTNNRLPDPQFLKNTIERAPFGIDPAWSSEVAGLFVENAGFVGFLREMNGSNYLVVEGGTASPDPVSKTTEVDEPDPRDDDSAQGRLAHPEPSHVDPEPPPSGASRAVPVQVFIAHGRNKKPLEQLKHILNEWQVPFVVAVDEPHAGRPISEKVADLMRACSAGIFVFTADDEFADSSGSTIFRPSQNVIYELGAAGLLYGRKIVIFKESKVSFPSDFSDLGWIEFETDALDARAMDLLREMIALKAVRLVSSTAE